MKTKTNQYRAVIGKYVPAEFVDVVVDLLIKYPVVFKVVKPRKTKLGDFRAGMKGEKHRITINGNLNPYSFLVTTIHEFAHLVNYENYGRRVAPHGKEWKNTFSQMLMPVINSGHLPNDLEVALMNSMVNVKASSCTDIHLNRALQKYDKKNDATVALEALEKNSTFALNGKTFRKGKLRRTRFLCTEEATNKQYLVNALAPVIEIKK